MLKKLLIGFGAIIVLLIAAAVIVPNFIPVETYKEQIAKQVRDATGREFAIKGDVGFSLFPVLGFEANDVAFGNAKGYADAQMATLAKVQVEVQLMPLLSGQISIDRFVLVDPVISLEVDKAGRPNWAFDAPGAMGSDSADKPKKQADAGAPGGTDISDISLGEVRLENGTVTFRDRTSGQEVRLAKINMDLDLPGISAPMVAKGEADWNKETVSLELKVTTPETLLAGKKTPVTLKVNSKPVTLAFAGSLTQGKVLSGGGAVDLDVPSVRNLAAWAGKPLDVPGTGFGPLKIKGKLGLNGARYDFSDAEIAFDAIRGKGAVSFDGGRRVPYIKASLAVDRLDLNPYLPPETADASGAGAASGSGTGNAGGGKAAQSWSDEKIDASGLRAVDADLDFKSGEILMRKIKVDRGAVKIALKGGRLALDLTDLALYGGQGSGQVVLDGSGKILAVTERFGLSGIQARPLLKDAAGMGWLEGGGNFAMDVAGRGTTQRQIVSSLNGKGNFKFTDGAIHGINIGKIVRLVGDTISTGGLAAVKAIADSQSLGEEKTDFAELSGTYVIRNGLLTNKDMVLLNPLVRVTGAGQADLPKRTVDYMIKPKVVATAKGQGGEKDLTGLEVPVRIHGPWHDMKREIDFAALIKNDPTALVKGLMGDKLKVPTMDVKSALPGKATLPAKPEEILKKPEEILKKPEEILKKPDGLLKKPLDKLFN